MIIKTYTQEDFEAAAVAGVSSLAKGSNRQALRVAILRAFGTASFSRAAKKTGIEFDIEETEEEPITELVDPMLKNTKLGSELFYSVVGLLKADSEFREIHADEKQNGQAWAFKLGGAINPARTELEKKCDALFDNKSIATNIKDNALRTLRK